MAFAAVPMVSGIQLKAGSRGVALSIAADAPFKAEFSAVGKQLTVKMPAVVYGVHDYTVTRFPVGSPLEKITAVETAGTSTVTVTFKFKTALTVPVKSVQRGNQWLVLLSNVAVNEYEWNATDSPEQRVQASSEVAATSSRNTISDLKTADTSGSGTDLLDSPAAASKLSSTVAVVASAARLVDIRILQRGAVEQLIVDFDQVVSMGLKRDGAILRVLVKNAGSTMKPEFVLPVQSAFKKVAVQSLQRGWLSIAITIRQNKNNPTVVQTLPRQLVLFAPVDTAGNRIAYWSAQGTANASYDIIEMAPTAVDLDQLGKKVLRDASIDIAQKSTFEINAAPKSKNVSSILVEKSVDQPAINKTVVVPPPEVKKAVAPVLPAPEIKKIAPRSKPLWVIKKDINLRTEPAVAAAVVRVLPLGTRVQELTRKNGWINIELGDLNKGWVSSTLVADSGAVPDVVWQEISRKKTTPVAKINLDEEALDALPPVAMVPAKTVVLPVVAKRRSIIEYRSYGRDPFVPLLREDDANDLFNVQEATLVGILYDKADKIALIEDRKNERKSYAIREHDPVKNGTVLRIERDQVVFLLTEMGISRTYSLKLNPKQDKPR